MKTTHPKIQAAIFDLGGVVIDIKFDRCFEAWAKASGKSFDAIRKTFSFDDMYAAHECARIDGKQYYEHICTSLGIDVSYADFEHGWNSIYVGVIPETIALLQELQSKVRLYAFTNSNLLHRKVWIPRFEQDLRPFKTVFCSSQLGLRKPEPEAFAKIVEEIDISKDRLVFVDDLIQNVQAAREFGIRSVLFENAPESVSRIRELIL